MRITKKFAGSNGIGKQIFSPAIETEKTLEMRKTLEREIDELEKRFFKKIDSSLAQQTLISPRKSVATTASSNGYRVAFPFERASSFTSYSNFLKFVDDNKTPSTSISTTIAASSTALEKSPNILPTPQSQNITPAPKPVITDKRTSAKPFPQPSSKSESAYVDEAYRVHGFEGSREETVNRTPPPSKTAFVSAPVTSKRGKEDKMHINKKYHVAKTEVPPAASNTKSESMAIDPSIDLHASALLLDFFRAARDKEYSLEKTSNRKRERVYVDHNYRVINADVQDLKRPKAVLNGGIA